MLRGKKLLIILGAFLLLIALVVGVIVYLGLDSSNTTSNEDTGPEISEEEQQINDQLTVVEKYVYEPIDDITAKDVPSVDKYGQLYAAGVGSVVDGDPDTGVAYLIAALEVANSEVDERDIQGTRDYLAVIAKTEDISEDTRRQIVETIGQEAIDSQPEGENRSAI